MKGRELISDQIFLSKLKVTWYLGKSNKLYSCIYNSITIKNGIDSIQKNLGFTNISCEDSLWPVIPGIIFLIPHPCCKKTEISVCPQKQKEKEKSVLTKKMLKSMCEICSS